MVNCTYCGADNAKNAKFCSRCGKPMMTTESSVISGLKPVPQARVITPIAGTRMPTGPTQVPSIGMCFYHRNLRASYICNRCGRQICADCAKVHGDMVFCPQCYSGIAAMASMPQTAKTTQAAPAPATPMQQPRSIIGTLLAVFGGLLVLFGAAVIYGGWPSGWLPFVQSFWQGATLQALAVIGVLSGMVVLLGATIMYQRNYEKAGAALIVAFASISLIVMGGFFVGFVLGIVGAILGTLKR